MKRFLFVLAVLIFVPKLGIGATIFESGTLGPVGRSFGEPGEGNAPGSSGVNPNVFSGVRFQMFQPAVTTRVGGHFVGDPQSEDSFFGAIVRLSNANDVPDSGNLSTPDVLGSTVLHFPNPSEEVFADMNVTLDPGWYALVFGSGLFGANGRGAAVLNNPDIGDPSYIAFQTGAVLGWGDLGPLFRNFRFVVEGTIVPEPTLRILLLGFIPLVLPIRLRNV